MWGGWLEAAWVRQWWWCEMQMTGTVLALLTPDAYTVNIYIYITILLEKALTSSEASCSSLQDPPGSPFLNHPWENSLIRECQLET